jgi:hydrogenase expression/formation protein HypD
VKYLEEYRDAPAAERLLRRIKAVVTRPWVIMEVCGSQTHTLLRYGIDQMLPEEITLVHGPGCPVCVTPVEAIDQAVALAGRPDVIFVSYGDMLRVPGTEKDLLSVKAEGGDVRMVYSPLDAVKLARQNPEKKVVFFAIGFEATAPANAMAVSLARRQGLDNFFVLTSHVLVPPAVELIAASPDNQVRGFLAPGHVCTVTGYCEYEAIARERRVPIVVTGFEPLDLIQGLLMLVTQLEEGRHEVENQYTRSVQREGNRQAQGITGEVFEVADHKWRGIGVIPRSGLRLREPYTRFDAVRFFDLDTLTCEEPEVCISGLVLQGVKKPPECPAFGTECTPERPLGAPMVSAEGACAAYYAYRRPEGRNFRNDEGRASPPKADAPLAQARLSPASLKAGLPVMKEARRR